MKRFLLLALSALLLSSASAQQSADTLRVAFEDAVFTLDSFATSSRLSFVLAYNWGDTLIQLDPETREYQPHLATSWEFIDDTTLEIVLRDDVTFHNGDPFGPEDVKATLEYITDPNLSLPGTVTLQWIDEVEIVDDVTVRIHTDGVNPIALESLSLQATIYPAAYIEENGIEIMATNPIGTGPYQFVSQTDSTIRFERYEDYFGGAKGQPDIGNLEIRIIPEEAGRIAALLSGEVEIVRGGTLSPDQALAVAGPARIETANILRVFFLQMDVMGKSGSDVTTNLLVRQAINHAINVEELVEAVLSGFGTPVVAPCNPAQVGCDSEFATTYDYDPERARELLAEAGYPDGVSVTLFAASQQQVAQAIQGYLAEVGIDANLAWFGGQGDVLAQRRAAGETELHFGSWGSSSIFDASAILNIHFRQGEIYSYVDSESLEEALATASNTLDPEARLASYAEAIGEITSGAYTVPLYSVEAIAGVANSVDWQPSPDELERYFLASWQ